MATTSTEWRQLDADVRRHFLDELRQARLSAQKDSEAFDELLFVFERLGCYRLRKVGTLGDYQKPLLDLAGRSVLGENFDGHNANWHSDKTVLYSLVRDARNDALHQGAGARHLTEHAIELALLFEDAIMNGTDNPMTTLRDIMVRTPAVAEPWQPLSFVRQVMLTNSFSILPIHIDDKWKVITDAQVAAFLRSGSNNRKLRLGMTVREAASEKNELLVDAVLLNPDTSINDVANRLANNPIEAFFLIISGDHTVSPQPRELLGIVTAFDIL